MRDNNRHSIAPHNSLAHHRIKSASLTPSPAAGDPDLIEARRNLREAHLADVIVKAVAEAPQLTDQQRSRLALLLRGAGNGTAVA